MVGSVVVGSVAVVVPGSVVKVASVVLPSGTIVCGNELLSISYLIQNDPQYVFTHCGGGGICGSWVLHSCAKICIKERFGLSARTM